MSDNSTTTTFHIRFEVTPTESSGIYLINPVTNHSWGNLVKTGYRAYAKYLRDRGIPVPSPAVFIDDHPMPLHEARRLADTAQELGQHALAESIRAKIREAEDAHRR